MVLSGSINKEIVARDQQGRRPRRRAFGQGRRSDPRQEARTRTRKDPDSNIEKVLDLGFVGEPVADQRQDARRCSEKSDIIPVIAPIGVGDDGETYNINADTVAGAVAAAVKATRFLLLTDVAGVLDKDKKLIPQLSVEKARDADRRRHDLRRHDPQGRDLPRRGAAAASRPRSSSMAACRTRSCWSCSPRAPAR